jgi:uncharacterized glyoxalase superfamily protein PhnB
MITNRSMPPAVIIPELPYPDVRETVDWLCRTFGLAERWRIGNFRARLSVGEGSLVVTQRNHGANASFSVMVRVNEIDSQYIRVKQAGPQIVSPPEDYPNGERLSTVQDPGGQRWTFSQTIKDVDPKTWGGILFED